GRHGDGRRDHPAARDVLAHPVADARAAQRAVGDGRDGELADQLAVQLDRERQRRPGARLGGQHADVLRERRRPAPGARPGRRPLPALEPLGVLRAQAHPRGRVPAAQRPQDDGAAQRVVPQRLPEGGPTRIGIERLEISRTSVTGELTFDDEAVAGTLTLAGGGIDGTVVLVPRGGGQGFDIALTADDATFGGATPLAIAEATIDVSGTVGGGNWTVSGSARGGGVNYGSLFLGRFAGRAEVTNGSGTFQASVTGRREARF